MLVRVRNLRPVHRKLGDGTSDWYEGERERERENETGVCEINAHLEKYTYVAKPLAPNLNVGRSTPKTRLEDKNGRLFRKATEPPEALLGNIEIRGKGLGYMCLLLGMVVYFANTGTKALCSRA